MSDDEQTGEGTVRMTDPAYLEKLKAWMDDPRPEGGYGYGYEDEAVECKGPPWRLGAKTAGQFIAEMAATDSTVRFEMLPGMVVRAHTVYSRYDFVLDGSGEDAVLVVDQVL